MTRAAGSLLGLVAALATAGVLGAQSPDAPLDAELVRRALAGTTDPADWTMLEEDALTAAAGPFVLRDVGVAEASVLELGLAGYGLPTLDQGLKPGEPTRVVVSLPGARSVFPHGYELAEPGDFTSVRVQQGPDGIQVVALLPPGRVAVIEEVAGAWLADLLGLPRHTIKVGVMVAGLEVPHVHVHLIPRYDGDVDEPRGGIRGIIPSKRNYSTSEEDD